jgi:hypothetical protein
MKVAKINALRSEKTKKGDSTMKKMFALILALVMVAFAGSAMACGFGQDCGLDYSGITITGNASQSSLGQISKSIGTGANGAGAGASFDQTSTGTYTATFSGKDKLNADGQAAADGFAKITSDLDKISNGYQASVNGTLNNSAEALVTSNGTCKDMNAIAQGTGTLNTATVAGIGLDTPNYVLGTTSTIGTFNYVIDPTKSVQGSGYLNGSGMTTVQTVGRDDGGMQVSTHAQSNAGASVKLLK